MKDQAMTDPIEQDELVEDFEPQATDEGKLPLSWWAVASCLLGIASVVLVVSIGEIVGLAAILLAVAARHDIRRGAKAGGRWASNGLWFGAIGLALSFALHVIAR